MSAIRTNALDKTIVKHILKDTTGDSNLMELVGTALFNSPFFFTKVNGQEIRHEVESRISYFSEDVESSQDKREAMFHLLIHAKCQDKVDEIGQRLVDLLTEGYKPRPTLPKVCPDGVIIGKIEDLTEEDAVSQSGDIFLKKLDFKIKYILRR